MVSMGVSVVAPRMTFMASFCINVGIQPVRL